MKCGAATRHFGGNQSEFAQLGRDSDGEIYDDNNNNDDDNNKDNNNDDNNDDGDDVNTQQQ